jgi:hypothetical protein
MAVIRVGKPTEFTVKQRGVGFDDVMTFAQLDLIGLLPAFDSQGRILPGPYAHRLNGFISVEERSADSGELGSAGVTELAALVTSGVLAVVPSQQEVQAVSSRFTSGSLRVLAFERAPDPAHYEYFWGFDNYSTSRLEKGDQVEHTFDGYAFVGIPQTPYSQGCKSGEYRFDTRIPIIENGAWTHDFTRGAIRVNGSTLRFRDTEPHVVITIPDSGQHYMGNGLAMMLAANCAY